MSPQREKQASGEDARTLSPSFSPDSGIQNTSGRGIKNEWIHSLPTGASHIQQECLPVPHSTHYLSPYATFHTASYLPAPTAKLVEARDFVVLTLHPQSKAQCLERGRHLII